MTIHLEQRASDWMAYFNGDKKLWDCGKTPNEAIANLIRTHGDRMGIVLEWPEMKVS